MHADIVYPWIKADAHSLQDLRYSLRSVEEMWKGVYRVTIVGDKPNNLDGFWHIPLQRIKDAHFPNCLDAVRKLQAVLDCGQVRQRFVYMYDDICLLQPMDMDLLEQRIGMYEVTPEFHGSDRMRKHKQLLMNTVKALKDKGLKRVWSYETHMPRVFEKRKMQEVMDIYRPQGNRLLHSTLYFNHHFPNNPPILLGDRPDIMARFDGFGKTPYDIAPAPCIDDERSVPYYLGKIMGKRFLNHNNEGAKNGLQNARHALFPDPSSHEPKPQILRVAR